LPAQTCRATSVSRGVSLNFLRSDFMF
jgi:hypothetical protein